MTTRTRSSRVSKHRQLTKKRQWGAEIDTTPLPIVHDKPSNNKIALSRLAIVCTAIFWIMYATSVVVRQLIEGPKNYHFTIEIFGYFVVVTFLTFSAFMYLIAREGAFQRFSKHVRVARALLDKFFAKNQPAITVLIPSYSEEPQVIRKTLLSAALQEYPHIRIVLLVDDNPFTTKTTDLERLTKTRGLGEEINNLLSEPFSKFSNALKHFDKENKGSDTVTPESTKELVKNYRWAAKWLNLTADKEMIEDHVDEFFADQVLRELAKDLSLVARALTVSGKEKAQLSTERIRQLYQRLVWIFGSEIKIFERKRYVSLSHEPNKAMNLNSYIGLMGGKYVEELSHKGIVLVPTKKDGAKIVDIPDSEFLLTLDADSVLLREYCLRLVYFLQEPDNSRVAVTQTPYSSFRGASSRIERLSGATTDIQHILHQGMSQHDATFWVGANAVIRKRALDDIVEKEWINGFEVKRYIQDSTVIEDTESSVDLVVHGWKLINYPERLSYSATPPDFGSLVVQRRRWANGGLLILPKLFAQVSNHNKSQKNASLFGTLLRINYMASIAWASFGLVFLLAYPYDGRLLSPFVLLAATPYFLAMASDLKYCRYKYSDVISIYGFNLILLPVNLAGVLKSIQQALTAKKIPFARTPKIKDRTMTELGFVVAPILIIVFSLFTVWRNVIVQNWGNAAFAGFNAMAAIWATVSFIGVGNLVADIWLGIADWLYVEVRPKNTKKETIISPALDWRSVLYQGEVGSVMPHSSMQEMLVNNAQGVDG
ncbi:MAG: Glycosyltransferase-like protein probably involved in cell wall biogenesis [Candidatus Collierbacteria bacterium GW2011_GWB1_44_6]|uniref:Glycosyltransferase-like protein probably involved in cell wall biogenesis n=2 Tax=Candidatus Collieribacteriota TaxID=1752725 RepID=A0A0G1MKP7_9BACT|nr:MAG: Glycosyltransferase-like protein probably involved in cell wall biogenesis [Candidatus Collierbacteria bacterium GW2011_GWC2_43_12]KKT72584.1 MAG: Glycosyltransferase-like protein probably involved in cell wall biogenesis [Candidatus Collierbacteria bacterium GW2011_GWB1_44_6]KKT83432.1 MAG: Glycosyltransferase-like protein probably involved in cell wall biogenesis [Microgenomates group bacterium GW2011_GWC1_44_9]